MILLILVYVDFTLRGCVNARTLLHPAIIISKLPIIRIQDETKWMKLGQSYENCTTNSGFELLTLVSADVGVSLVPKYENLSLPIRIFVKTNRPRQIIHPLND